MSDAIIRDYRPNDKGIMLCLGIEISENPEAHAKTGGSRPARLVPAAFYRLLFLAAKSSSIKSFQSSERGMLLRTEATALLTSR